MENNKLKALWEISRASLALAHTLSDDVSLNILLDLESVLDRGRAAAGIRETELDQIRFKETVANMDELRGIIRTLIHYRNKEEMEKFMKERGKMAMQQFSIN